VEVAVVVEKFVEESSWSAEVVGVTTKRTENGLVVEIVLTDSPLMPDAEDVASHLASELDETIAVTMQVVQVETERATVDEEEAE
jgi:enoyl-CoA hydratase/carnithine racemase